MLELIFNFFVFSWGEILTSLRFLMVVLTAIIFPVIAFVFIIETAMAISYGRFVFNIGGKIKFNEVYKFVRHCYSVGNFGAKRTYEDGSYWNGIGDWRYLDKKKNKYINGRYSKDKW